MREFKNKTEMETYYLGLYHRLKDVAFKHGYALTTHGTMRRDLDIVAIPWVREAKGYTTLYRSVFKAAGARKQDQTVSTTKKWSVRPHGRVAIAIHLPFLSPERHYAYIDLSILRPISH